MKTIALLFVCILSSTFLTAQNETLNSKKREVALTVKSLSQYGFGYKFGNQKALWRINAYQIIKRSQSTGNINKSTTDGYENYAINFGRAFIKPVSEKLEFRYGAGLSVDYSFSSFKQKQLTDVDWKKVSLFSSGIFGIIALHYALNNTINIGAESTLGGSYQIGKETIRSGRDIEESNISGFVFNINNVATLILTCKF